MTTDPNLIEALHEIETVISFHALIIVLGLFAIVWSLYCLGRKNDR